MFVMCFLFGLCVVLYGLLFLDWLWPAMGPDTSKPKPSPFYISWLAQAHRWHIVSQHTGDILANGGQGYSRKIDAEDGFLAATDIMVIEAAKIRAARALAKKS